MIDGFELVTRDICSVLHEQTSCTDFDGQWDYVPFMDFNSEGDRTWTNLMSGDWAAKQAVRDLYLFIYSCFSHWVCRTIFLRILIHTGLCLSA
jgi:hypothetical protein